MDTSASALSPVEVDPGDCRILVGVPRLVTRLKTSFDQF